MLLSNDIINKIEDTETENNRIYIDGKIIFQSIY